MKLLTEFRLVNLTFYSLFVDLSCGVKILSIPRDHCRTGYYSNMSEPRKCLHGLQDVDGDCAYMEVCKLLPLCLYLSPYMLHIHPWPQLEFILSSSPEAYSFFERLFQCLLNKALSFPNHIFPLEFRFVCGVQTYPSTHQSEPWI